MLDFIQELEGMPQPGCCIWGDQDHVAPAPVLHAYRAVPARLPNVEVHVFPGVQHGYMMRGSGTAFDQKVYDFSIDRALALLDGLR
jgi:carboxymethylenebutenolidase